MSNNNTEDCTMTRKLNDDELGMISGGARKLGLNIDRPQFKVWTGATKQTADGGDDDAPDTSGNMAQNPGAGDPNSIY
jgi:hypothetical protein